MASAKVAIFDSGLGGLTVYRALKARLPGADYVYLADSDAFPYGDWHEAELVERILALFRHFIANERPDICVIACNTASTIALAPLRQHFDRPFVGTVPAVKVAAEQSRSRLFSVLATPGTVKRDYTRELIDNFAGHCRVTLVGASRLAALAESVMRGEGVDEAVLRGEVAPAFVTHEGLRTDAIVLGCTHFPLLQEAIEKVAPWPVRYIDPAPAIARQTDAVLRAAGMATPITADGCRDQFLFTGRRSPDVRLIEFLHEIGFRRIEAPTWADKPDLFVAE